MPYQNLLQKRLKDTYNLTCRMAVQQERHLVRIVGSLFLNKQQEGQYTDWLVKNVNHETIIVEIK